MDLLEDEFDELHKNLNYLLRYNAELAENPHKVSDVTMYG